MRGGGVSSQLKSYATNFLYYQHLSIFATMFQTRERVQKMKRNKLKEEFTIHIIYAGIYQNLLLLDLLTVTLRDS